MTTDYFKELGTQLGSIWSKLRPLQQASIIGITVFLLGFFTLIIFSESQPSYVALFPNEKFQLTNQNEITRYLDNLHVSYKVDSDSTILVDAEEAQRARTELSALGIPKSQASKGFDLFDNHTWMRGEKELQILEVRALKGQLEQDLSHFDNIRSASVILDIASPKPFGGNNNLTKASVILSLMPGVRLSQSEIQAITYHISGAVRGLTPAMVAISDTSGRLYQPWSNGNEGNAPDRKFQLEVELTSKIEGLLAFLVGPKNYFAAVNVLTADEVSAISGLPKINDKIKSNQQLPENPNFVVVKIFVSI